MAVLDNFVAGPYTWTYNARYIGITENGFNLRQTSFGESVRGDNMGDSTQDYVYRGGDVFMDGVLQNWDMALQNPNNLAGGAVAKTNALTGSIFWPWSLISAGALGQVGRLGSIISAPLIGTPVAGTTAAATDVKTITLTRSILAPGSNISMLFAARLRNVPISLQALPLLYTTGQYASDSGIGWFNMT